MNIEPTYKFLKELSQQGILVEAENGKLQLSFENDEIDQRLLEEIKRRKEEIISFLSRDHAAEAIPDTTLVALFREQASNSPEAIALVVEDREYTYAELDTLSHEFAAYLKESYAVSGDDVVGIQLERNEWFIVAVLAVLKLGAAYLPIDNNLPGSRKKMMLDDAAVKLLVTAADKLIGLDYFEGSVLAMDVEFYPGMANAGTALPEVNPGNIAYIIYTSGSTGKPKGVVIKHENIVNTILSQIKQFNTSKGNRLLQFASFSFDASVWEIFIGLSSGATLYMINEADRNDPASLGEFIVRNNIDWLTLPPSYFNLMDVDKLKNVDTLITAGEPPSFKQVNKYLQYGNYYNAYGPTETSICATVYKVSRGSVLSEESIPIGKPVAHTSVYILNAQNELQEDGKEGEIVVAGKGISSGYLNLKQLTSERFIQSPFNDTESMYKTGDFGYKNENGDIVFTGRKDEQIKIRGLRVELGEIEVALNQIREIKDVFVTTFEEQGVKELVAYYVAENKISDARIRTALEALLPQYMIPKHYYELDVIPLNSNGKRDKSKLPGLAAVSEVQDVPEKSALSDKEKILYDLWRKVLKKEDIAPEDDFFKLGGHSIDVIKVINGLEVDHNIVLELQDFFKERTLNKIALKMTDAAPVSNSLEQETDTIPGEAIASQKQKYFWLLAQKNEDLPYHVPVVLKWNREPIHADIFQKALERSVQKHTMIRTGFEEKENEIYQVVASEAKIDFERRDLKTQIFSKNNLDKQVQELISERIALDTPALFKCRIYEYAGNESALVFVVHHIIMDAWSIELWINEILEDYFQLAAGNELPVAENSFNAVKYPEARYNSDSELYWKKELENVEKFEFPWNRSSDSTDWNASSVSFEIGQEETEALKALAASSNTSLFGVVLSGLYQVLGSLTDADKITLGLSFSGRDKAELKDVVGNFVSLLPLTADRKNTYDFKELVSWIQEKLGNASKHQAYPIEQLIDQLQLTGNIFNAGMTWFGNYDMLQQQVLRDNGLSIIESDQPYAKFPLWMYGHEKENKLTITIEYRTQNFTPGSISMFAEIWKQKMSDISSGLPSLEASRKDFLPVEYQKEILQFSKGQEVSNPVSVVAQFGETIKRYPQQIALNFCGEEFSYEDFDREANVIANKLINDHGVQKGDPVLLLLDKSPLMFMSIMGVLKAGGVYVPLQPGISEDQLSYTIADIQPVTAVMSSHMMHLMGSMSCPVIFIDLEIESERNERAPEIAVYPEDFAYIVYTSGTTGRPKGVKIPHKSITRLTNNSNFQDPKSDDVNLCLSDYSFDGSVQEIFTTFLNGGTLVCISSEKLLRIAEIKSAIATYGINNIPFITTQLFNQIVDHDPDMLNAFRSICFGGEDASVVHVKKALETVTATRINNVYGPTENAVFSTFYEIKDIPDVWTGVPIGKPVSGTNMYILNTERQMLPIGVMGEIYLSGEGLAQGYINNEPETNKRFVPNPFEEGSLLYATGDYGFWDENGNVVYRGRKDKQVKIRGYRVEIRQVQNALNNCESVKSAFIAVKEKEGRKELVAFVVPKEGAEISGIKQELRSEVSSYSFPSYFVKVEEIPLNKNGKVDAEKLLTIDIEETDIELPSSEIESKLLRIWKDELGIEALGVNSDFFDYGGQSIKAISVMARIEKDLGMQLSFADFFTTPTVREIAKVLKESNDQFKINKAPETGSIPASHAQKRIWLYQQLNPASVKYNIVGIYEVTGNFDERKIEKALNALVARHSILRTSFYGESGKVYQQINRSTPHFFEVIDDKNSTLTEILDREQSLNEPFDLKSESLFRIRLIHASDKQNVLYFSIHHIICDEWSLARLLKDFAAFADDQELLPVALEYKDYAVWHNAFTLGEGGNQQMEFWREYLQGAGEPAGFEHEKTASVSRKVAQYQVEIDAEKTAALQSMCNAEKTTLFVGLLNLLNVLLYKYSGKDDLILGIPVAGRQQEDLHPLIGCFVNMLPVRTKLDPESSFSDLLRAGGTNIAEVLENQQLPYDMLIDTLSEGNQDFFQTGLTWHNVMDNIDLSDVTEGALNFKKFDYGMDEVFQELWFFGRMTNNKIILNVRYNEQKYSQEKIAEIAEDLLSITHAVTAPGKQKINEIKINRDSAGFEEQDIDEIQFNF